jgi:hypothetical protein
MSNALIIFKDIIIINMSSLEEIKDYNNLSYEQRLNLLKIELIKVKNEIETSKLIYSYHDCDSYEDLFRDNIPLLEVKYDGILIAIENMTNIKLNSEVD